MAAPHVAGGAALILQRVEKEFPNLTGTAKVTMVKNLLMSTASPVGDFGTYNSYYGLSKYNFTSPRRQGAGVMDVYAAATTPAIVMDKTSGLSKVNLKQIGDTSQFVLSVYNFGSTPISYNIKGTVQTDLTVDNVYNNLETQGVYVNGTVSDTKPWVGQYPISFDKTTINVPAGGKCHFKFIQCNRLGK
jgi:lactocepin